MGNTVSLSGAEVLEQRARIRELETMVRELEALLGRQRELTEHERLRADVAEASRDQAWRLAAGFAGRLRVKA